MKQITIKDAVSGSSAKIAVERGFNCYEFQAVLNGIAVDVLDSDPGYPDGVGRPSGNGIPLLFPFPNRIRGGKYSWNGQDYEMPLEILPDDSAGNAIHGFCLDLPWRVTSSGENFVVGEFQLSVDAPDRLPYWPTDCLIEIRYELIGARLRSEIRVVNPTEIPLPWGFGTHAYFRLPLSAESEPSGCLVQAPVSEQWDLVECLPTGKREPVSEEKDLSDGTYFGTLQLDDVYTGVKPVDGIVECIVMDERAGLQIAQRCPDLFREIVAYTPPDRNAVCLEPYTCVTDAINLQQQDIDAGWLVLEPGGEFRTWIDISVEQVIA